MTSTPSLLKRTSLSLALLGLMQFFICWNNTSQAQYRFSLSANYVYCFGERIIDLQGATYHLDHTQGFEVLARNNYQLNTKLDIHLNLGFRYLTFAGRSENIQYNGALNKVFASGGLGYALTKKIRLNAYIEAENNVAFNQFIFGSGDLFRINLAAELMYPLSDRLFGTILVSRAMTPITNAYIFTNPQYQFRVGLNYRLFK